MGKLTIRDFLNLKGKRQITSTTAFDPIAARAAEAAGIDVLITGNPAEEYGKAMIRMARANAPTRLITSGLPFRRTPISDEEAIRLAVGAIEAGADLVYPGVGPKRVKAMAEQKIAVHVHCGLVPIHCTWIGGIRAVGKTAKEALEVYRSAMAYAEAGAVMIEMECVPEKVASEIAKRVPIPVISIGSGSGCDGIMLLDLDLLGNQGGGYPRHSKVYRHFLKEAAAAFGEFRDDVQKGAFPAKENTIDISEQEFERFVNKIDSRVV